jgi:hypothetical protein
MKKVVQVTEVDGEGFEALLDKQVLIFCMSYIYTGKLIGVNKSCVLLSDPCIVYETGAWGSTSFQDAQGLPNQLYVQISSVESFCETNKKK